MKDLKTFVILRLVLFLLGLIQPLSGGDDSASSLGSGCSCLGVLPSLRGSSKATPDLFFACALRRPLEGFGCGIYLEGALS